MAPDAYTKLLLQFSGLYADLGWKLVALHGFHDGRCTCHLGADCNAPGKHPVLKDWKGSATNVAAEIVARMERYPHGNLGVLLGPESGVIDIEFDCEQGRKTAEKLFAGVVTPTYTSGRSTHYFFKWNARLPDVQKLTPKDGLLAGLEIRIGNGGKSTQSVLPPSRHHSGAQYKWLDGMAAGMVEPVELSREILAAIVNYDPTGESRGSGKGLEIVRSEAVSEGGRNDMLFRYACMLAGMVRNIASSTDQQMIHDMVQMANEARCRPPLPDAEVRTTVESAIFTERSGKQRRGEEVTPQQAAEQAIEQARPASYAAMGLGYDNDRDTWTPGNWHLEVVMADPVYYRLVIPAFCPLTSKGDGGIEIPTSLIDRAGEVARLIRQGTNGQAVVNPFPGQWEHIWNGRKPQYRGRGENKVFDPGCEGLFSQLIYAAEKVAGSAYDNISRLVKECLYAKLASAHDADTDQETNKEILRDKDVPTRFGSTGAVYVSWDSLFLDEINQKLFTKEDVRKVRKELNLDDPKRNVKPRFHDGKQARMVIFSEDDVKSLESELYYDSSTDDTPF